MSSENEKKIGEPGSGPKTESLTGAGTGWKPGDALECAWGLIANAGGGDWDREGPEWKAAAIAWRDRYWHPAPGERPPTVIVETGYVGAERKAYPNEAEAVAMAEFPPAGMDGQTGVCKICERGLVWDGSLCVWRHSAAMDGGEPAHVGHPKVAKCPHCQHFGPVDHECSHETCQNCGLALDEPPAEGLPGATGIPGPPDGKMSAAELLEVREIETAAGGGVCPKCALVFVNGECPNCHFSGIMQAFRGPEAEPAAEKLPCECWRMAGFRNCPRHRHLCEPPDLVAFQTGVGAATEPPFDKEPSLMPSWLPEVLGQARAADLADAGHRLAKCGVCGRLLYEKSGVFIHDGSGVEHVGVPTEIFDPAPANTAGVCFTCPPVGFFEALLNRLFPQEFPQLPEVEWAPANAAPKGDVIHLTGVTHFSVLDRLRLIVSGRLMTRAMIVCENEAGRTKSVMTVRPLAPGRGRE